MLLKRWGLILLLGSLFVFAGCGEDEEPVQTTTVEEPAPTDPDISDEGLGKSTPAELSAISQKLAAAYMTVKAESVNMNGDFVSSDFTAEDLAAKIASDNPDLGEVVALDPSLSDEELMSSIGPETMFVRAKATNLTLGYRTQYGEEAFLIVQEGRAPEFFVEGPAPEGEVSPGSETPPGVESAPPVSSEKD